MPLNLHGSPMLRPPEMERRLQPGGEQDQLAHFLRTASRNRELLDCPLSEAISLIFTLEECVETSKRTRAEAFIRDCFAAGHDAQISQFLPRLFQLETRRGELAAAFGMRCAKDQPLFLEHYLDRPIELELATMLDHVPSRDKIVEIGNLAAALPGAVRWLIVALTVRLFQEDYEWVAFTGTKELRNGFRRLGLRPITLRAADITRLDETEHHKWGSYYTNRPLVMAGNIGYGYHEMKKSMRFPKPGQVSLSSGKTLPGQGT